MPRKSMYLPFHDQIVSRVQAGDAIVHIADDLKLPRSGLKNYLRRRAIHSQRPRNAPKLIDEARLRELIAAGHTHTQVGKSLGVSKSAIERRCGKLGLQTCRTGPRSGHGSPEWNGGRRLQKYGYIGIYVPLHPHANRSSHIVLEHRLVMEVLLGRYLEPLEVVHHKDDRPYHNWPNNLELFASNADHLRHELSHREKPTPRSSIPGAYGSNQTIDRCPDEHETLALCPSEIRLKLALHIESHRTTSEHRTLSRRQLRGQGAWRPAFQWPSTV